MLDVDVVVTVIGVVIDVVLVIVGCINPVGRGSASLGYFEMKMKTIRERTMQTL